MRAWSTCIQSLVLGAILLSATRAAAQEPRPDGGMAPIYGMAATLPDRLAIDTMLKGFVDLWFRP